METLTQAIQTALGTVKTDLLSVMGIVAASGLAIFGVKFAATQGLNFFKKVSK